MKPDCKNKHARITFILLDDPANLTLDDDAIREMVHDCFKPPKPYRTGKGWAKDMGWNRRFIYTMIGFLERRSEYGDPTQRMRNGRLPRPATAALTQEAWPASFSARLAIR